MWVVANKLRLTLSRPIPFTKYIDYDAVRQDAQVNSTPVFLGVNGVKRICVAVTSLITNVFGDFNNR